MRIFMATAMLLCGVYAAAEDNPVRTQPWAELLDHVKSDAALEPARAAFIGQARETLGKPVVRRAHALADVGKNRTWLDGRANALEDEIREHFALAMSDFAACNLLSTELPTVAAAYRLSGDNALLERVTAQLEEMASWSPLQRPGWTLYTPGSRLPKDGKDGNWLATGCGVRAIATTLEVLPKEAVTPELRKRLVALLESEIAGVVDDWQSKRPWFVRGNNPVTNQWVLPTEGLVRACLTLGVEEHREAYELGVKNLLAALDAHGPNGEFEEGFGYATFTMAALLHASYAMAAAGDRRGIDHAFLKNFPVWLVHHFQPGHMTVNCFDAGGAYDGAERTRPLLSLLAVCTGSPAARWALAYQVQGPSDDLPGLAANALPPVGPEAAPPCFAAYGRAARVNWRSSWDTNATGVWVRGGHPLDQHDHQDRGHVNFILHGRPILIEAGTPAYSHPRMMAEYTPGVGHNVLQLGLEMPPEHANAGTMVTRPGWQKAGGVAPIQVGKLDAEGGGAVVDGTACYDGLARWIRSVSWNAESLEVSDEVKLKEKESNVVLFRWHLGTEAQVIISGDQARYIVAWPDARMEIQADAPIMLQQTMAPDHTLANHTDSDDQPNVHTCIVIRSAESVEHINVDMTVKAP